MEPTTASPLSDEPFTAETTLPAIFCDHMVLQQMQRNPIWGWDRPDTEVAITMAGQTHTTKADAGGRWEVMLEAMPASADPKEMTVSGSSNLTVRDILVGEVWLCSGQSNMEWPLDDTLGGDLAKLSAANPCIRIITLPMNGTQEPQTTFCGKWECSTPDTSGKFSAVGYHFGKILHDVLGVPVGLIRNAIGGSSAEAWVRRSTLERDGRFGSYLEKWKRFEEESAKGAGTGSIDPLTDLAGIHRPGNLYAGILHPILGYGIRGTIWYQGESNAERAYQYDQLMELLITSWRREWGQGSFPFYFAQLANYQDQAPQPEESDWAELREAQASILKSVPDTGQAVTIDLGEAGDIHPREKRAVAERLVRWALALDYGFEIEYRSPEFREMTLSEGKAILTFDHAAGGLVTAAVNEVRGFSICGEDRNWKYAEAKIAGRDAIEVFSKDVPQPVAIRYAWASNPVCNVRAANGLPLTPFRTDDFPKLTDPGCTPEPALESKP